MADELTRRIKELVLASNLDYVGVASAELLTNEPEFRKPKDFLPGAKSIISFGIKIGLGTQLVNRRAHRTGRRNLIYAYLWHGFGLPSLHYVDRASILVTRLLEKEGYLAVPVMSASTFDIRSTLTEFSNHHAAVAAGLADLGWCGFALTPDAGPRVRFGAVITTAKLTTDPMRSGQRLCNVEECKKINGGVQICAAVCPTAAIILESEQVKIGDRVFTVGKFDTWRCAWASMGLTKKALGVREIPMPAKVTVDDLFAALKQRDPTQASELMVINRGDYCGKCIMECPVAAQERVEKSLKIESGSLISLEYRSEKD